MQCMTISGDPGQRIWPAHRHTVIPITPARTPRHSHKLTMAPSDDVPYAPLAADDDYDYPPPTKGWAAPEPVVSDGKTARAWAFFLAACALSLALSKADPERGPGTKKNRRTKQPTAPSPLPLPSTHAPWAGS